MTLSLTVVQADFELVIILLQSPEYLGLQAQISSPTLHDYLGHRFQVSPFSTLLIEQPWVDEWFFSVFLLWIIK